VAALNLAGGQSAREFDAAMLVEVGAGVDLILILPNGAAPPPSEVDPENRARGSGRVCLFLFLQNVDDVIDGAIHEAK
jgi:hypothetical protein